MSAKATAPVPSASAPPLGKKQGSTSAGKAKAPVPAGAAVALGKGKAKAPVAAAPAPALGRKGGKAAVHAPVLAPAGHAGQTKGKKEDAKTAGKHALAPAPGVCQFCYPSTGLSVLLDHASRGWTQGQRALLH